MKFFVVSAGDPTKDYIEDNFKDILNSNEFALHPKTKQKGTYYSIESGDVLILKYKKQFVAYGVAVKKYEDNSKSFSLRVKVTEWIAHEYEFSRKGVSIYGIKKATISGGNRATVRTVRPNFGMDKIREINSSNPVYKKIETRNKEENSLIIKDGNNSVLHEEILNFLLDRSKENPDFSFVVRSSNNRSNLEEGYWFYGKETVAVSFWTGFDHPNKRPAISFLINPNQHCELVIQTDIYPLLRESLTNLTSLTSELAMEEKEGLFTKKYSEFNLTDYIKSLENFIKYDYHTLNILTSQANPDAYGELFVTSIIPFPTDEFYSRLNNLFRYRQKNAPDLTYYSLKDEEKADKIEKISINNFGLIKNVQLEFDNSNWIFITGENGTGKTTLLRAIGTVLGRRTLSKSELNTGLNFTSEATMSTDGRSTSFNRIDNEMMRTKRSSISRGLAMYGPYRLQQTSGMIQNSTFRKSLSKLGSFKSLFEEGSKLLSLDKQIEVWSSLIKNKNNVFDERIRQITSLLPRLIEDLRHVDIKKKSKGKFKVEYLVNTKGTNDLTPLKWSQLSSGNKSTLNLVTDILIRLFNQQPKVTDPSELRGVVIIDEIDLHLHPKAQKDLVITLSETFPLIQFIVSTHSPIPLLGAPKNSIIYVVNRSSERGVYSERIDDDLFLENMLPNSILTSPIFGFQDLFPISHDENKKIRTEDTYEEIKKTDELKEYIKSIALKMKND